MHIKKDGLWDYRERWKELFKGDHELLWQDNWLKNTWCSQCRYCCGPQDSAKPFPMALLPRQVKDNMENNFHLLDKDTAFLGREGCKSDTPHGCRLKITEKPVACNLFPIVLVNGRLYLYQCCPAALATPLVQMLDIAKDIAKMLEKYSLEELRHISIDLLEEELSAKYIDLHIKIFDPKQKSLELF